ncbi:hypothetical protein BY458DRAFT_505251 [Sporodiniella umbellata]|nr:hypothetical protein BY458DRAFT_505251 [Sporodiniella umbellata]
MVMHKHQTDIRSYWVFFFHWQPYGLAVWILFSSSFSFLPRISLIQKNNYYWNNW